MAGTSWPALLAGRKARASDVESKFDWMEGSLVPMNSGASTDAALDIGTTTAQWRFIYVATTGAFMQGNTDMRVIQAVNGAAFSYGPDF